MSDQRPDYSKIGPSANVRLSGNLFGGIKERGHSDPAGMTPPERALAARNLRELALTTEEKLQNLHGHYSDRELLMATGSAVIVLADMVAMLFEDGLDAETMAVASGLPGDAQERTENEDTPDEAASLAAAEGAVPGDVHRTPVDRLELLPTSSQRLTEQLGRLRAELDREEGRSQDSRPPCDLCELEWRHPIHNPGGDGKGSHLYVEPPEVSQR